MTQVLEDLADEFDFVVIDGPPLLPVADAQVMLHNPAIDVVLIVARPYLTTREHIRTASAVLKRHPEKGFGLVVNGVRERARGYYGYSQNREDDGVLLGPGGLGPGAARTGRPIRNSRVRRVPRSARTEDLDQIVDPSSEPS
jgi:Mrp family chromosome partitioning ATPase